MLVSGISAFRVARWLSMPLVCGTIIREQGAKIDETCSYLPTLSG